MASTPLSGSHGAGVKAKPKRRLSCKTSDTHDPSGGGSSSAKLTGVFSPELAAPRRRLKRNATVAGLTEPYISVPYVDSNMMPASAGDSLGASTSVSTVPAIEASPRCRIVRKTTSSAVPGSVGMTGGRGDAVGINCDRQDAVVVESEDIPGDILAGAIDTATPADAVAAEPQQEQHLSIAASPSRQLLREESSLSRALSRVMGEESTTESVAVETPQVHDVDFVTSPRRRLLGKTSSACPPVSPHESTPPVLLPGEEVWRRFTPSVINPLLCLARTYNAGAGGQCKRKPQAGEVICGNCKKLAHGRVDGPIPAIKLANFLRLAGET